MRTLRIDVSSPSALEGDEFLQHRQEQRARREHRHELVKVTLVCVLLPLSAVLSHLLTKPLIEWQVKRAVEDHYKNAAKPAEKALQE